MLLQHHFLETIPKKTPKKKKKKNQDPKMSLSTLRAATMSEQTALQYLRDKLVIRRAIPNCTTCGRAMTSIIRHRNADYWRCPSRCTKMSFKNGSFWSKSQLTFVKCVDITYCWAHKISIKTTSEMTGMSRQTIIDWFGFLREVCICSFAYSNIKSFPKVACLN